MSNFKAFGVLLATMLVTLSVAGCGSGWVKGWRNDQSDARTDEQKCNSWKHHVWTNGTCQEIDEGADLTHVDQQTCDKIPNAGWIDGQCIGYAKATKDQCAEIKDWAWSESGKACEPAAQAECDADPNKVYVKPETGDAKCVDRPAAPKLDGATTQSVPVGVAMQPIAINMDANERAELVNATCAGFLTIKDNKITSAAAKADTSPNKQCEADVVAKLRGADVASLPQHVTVKIIGDGGQSFLALCKAHLTDATELGRTLSVIQMKSQKSACEDVSKWLDDQAELDLSDESIQDLSPLGGLSKLTALDLRDDPVTDLSALAGISTLNWVGMSGTPLGRDASKRTPENCPTADGVAPGVKRFCTLGVSSARH